MTAAGPAVRRALDWVVSMQLPWGGLETEAVGAWETISRGAEAVRHMEISDARLKEVLRPVLLHFDAPVERPVLPTSATR